MCVFLDGVFVVKMWWIRGELSLLKRRVKNMPRSKDYFRGLYFFATLGELVSLTTKSRKARSLAGGRWREG